MTANHTNITQEMLCELLRYEPETGRLFWRERAEHWFPDKRLWKSWNSRCAGTEAFTVFDRLGYRRGTVLNKTGLAHRFIWVMVYGSAAKVIDHINGDTSDNRIANLRSVDQQTNRKNSHKSKANTSGVNGVYWRSDSRKWRAIITVDGEPKYLGDFIAKDDAIAARAAADIHYGYHETHGKR